MGCSAHASDGVVNTEGLPRTLALAGENREDEDDAWAPLDDREWIVDVALDRFTWWRTLMGKGVLGRTNMHRHLRKRAQTVASNKNRARHRAN